MCTAASGVGGDRPAASATRNRETNSGERMAAISLIRPPQRSQTSTFTAKTRRSRSLLAMRFHGGTFEAPCLKDVTEQVKENPPVRLKGPKEDSKKRRLSPAWAASRRARGASGYGVVYILMLIGLQSILGRGRLNSLP